MKCRKKSTRQQLDFIFQELFIKTQFNVKASLIHHRVFVLNKFEFQTRTFPIGISMIVVTTFASGN